MSSRTLSIPPTTHVTQHAQRMVRARKGMSVATVAAVVLLLLCVGTAALVLFFLLPKRQQAPPIAPPIAQGVLAASPQACNPLCSPIFQSCRLVPTAPASGASSWSGTECVNNCGFTSLPMNQMCIGSTKLDVCLTNVPTGTGTAVILQSQVPGPDGKTFALTAKQSSASSDAPPLLVLEEAQLDNFNQYFTFLSTSVNMCKPTSTACSESALEACPCNCSLWPDYHIGDFGSDPTPLQCPVPGASPAAPASTNAFAGCTATTDKIMAPCKNSYKVLVTAAQNPVGPGWAVQAAPTVTATSTAPVKMVAQEAATWREIPGAQAHMFVPFRDDNPTTGSLPSSGVWLTDVSFDRCEGNRTAVLTAMPPPKSAASAPPVLRWVGNAFPSGVNPDASALKPWDGWNVIPVGMTQEFFITHSCEAGVRVAPPSFTSSKIAHDVSSESRVWGDWDACTGRKKD